MNPFNRVSLIFALFFTLSFAAFAQDDGCPTCDDPANCSKFVFEFVPEKVVAAPGETLKVEIQKWRTTKWLNEATRLQPNRCPEDRDISAPLDKIHIPTGNWVVIVQDGKTYTSEQYLPPRENQSDAPGYIRTIPVSKAVVRTVRDTELADASINLSDLPEGDYWFTLQNIANINDGERCELECNKTTPPMKIKIKKDGYYPKVTATVYGGECDPVHIIMALATDKDNDPGMERPRQTLRLEGTLTNVDTKSTRALKFSPEGSVKEWFYERIIFEKDSLEPGKYDVEVRVTDGEYSAEDKETFTVKSSKECEPEPPSIPAAVLYFQFDEPRRGETANASVESSDPARWNAKESREKCPTPPSAEFPRFIGEDLALGTNTERLEKIGKFLQSNKNFYLTIKAFTDSKACDTYNCNLGRRRAQAVKDHLDRNFELKDKNGNSRVTITTINRGEADALKSYPYSPEGINCSNEQKWDRRVELYYTKEKDDPDIGPCATEACRTGKKGSKSSIRKRYGKKR